MRFVKSQRGSSKCGGVGVEGSISASAMCVWNLTASAPAPAAASIRRSARSISPLWLLPISAITKTCGPSDFPAIFTGSLYRGAPEPPAAAQLLAQLGAVALEARDVVAEACFVLPRPRGEVERVLRLVALGRVEDVRLEERDVVELRAQPLDQQRPGALPVDRPVRPPGPDLRHRLREQWMAGDAADHGVRDAAGV